jgi:hypothetical protein
MPVTPPQPSWRKPAGIFFLLALIAAWGWIVVSLAEYFPGAPWPVRAAYFVVAGIIWIAPLKPLLRWMETGRFRQIP